MVLSPSMPEKAPKHREVVRSQPCLEAVGLGFRVEFQNLVDPYRGKGIPEGPTYTTIMEIRSPKPK